MVTAPVNVKFPKYFLSAFKKCFCSIAFSALLFYEHCSIFCTTTQNIKVRIANIETAWIRHQKSRRGRKKQREARKQDKEHRLKDESYYSLECCRASQFVCMVWFSTAESGRYRPGCRRHSPGGLAGASLVSPLPPSHICAGGVEGTHFRSDYWWRGGWSLLMKFERA